MSDLVATMAKADAEMTAFLNQANADGVQPAAQDSHPQLMSPQKAEITEDDFVDNMDGEVDEGTTQTDNVSTPAQGIGNEQPTGDRAAPTGGTSVHVSHEQLDFLIRSAEERGRLSALSQQPVQQPAQPQSAIADDALYPEDQLVLTEEEKQNFNPETIKLAEKIANRAANELYRKQVVPLRQALQQQNDHIAKQQEGVAKTAAQMLYSQVQSIIPDLPTLTQTKGWQSYLQSASPLDSSVTIGDIFRSHLGRGRVDDIVGIINTYKQAQPGASQQMAMAPGMASTGTPQTSTNKQSVKMLSYAKFQTAQQQYVSGLMTYDEYSKVEALYARAAAEGRIKY